MRGEVIREVGRELFRAEDVQVLSVGKVVQRIEADGIELRVEIHEVVAVLLHDGRELQEHGVAVFDDGAVREAGEEHVLDAQLPGRLAERAQRLLVERIEVLLADGDLVAFEQVRRNGQKRLRIGIARGAGLALHRE